MRASRLVHLTFEEEEPSASSPHPTSTFTVKDVTIESVHAAGEAQDAEHLPPKNPLNMFGILVPQSLRSAQASAITMVEQVIPQLASLDAVMKETEISIRRARKHHKRELAHKNPAKDMTALEAMATRDDPPPPGVLREGPAPPYVEVRFAEEWE